jgi:hypothetical protein
MPQRTPKEPANPNTKSYRVLYPLDSGVDLEWHRSGLSRAHAGESDQRDRGGGEYGHKERYSCLSGGR